MNIDVQLQNKIERKISAINEVIFKEKDIPAHKKISVSTCIDFLHEEFDKEKVAERCSKKGFNDPKSKYYQKTASDIIGDWEAKRQVSLAYGRNMDKIIEILLSQTPDVDKAKAIDNWKDEVAYEYNPDMQAMLTGFIQFLNFLNESGNYDFVSKEQHVYYETPKGNIISGRYDALFERHIQNAKNESECFDLLIIDYKTNETIEKKSTYGKKMYGPCFNLDDCNLNHYTVQLYAYYSALVHMYHIIKPENCNVAIVQFHKKPNLEGKFFSIHSAGFPYNKERFDQIVDYAIEKRLKKNSED